MGAAFFEKNYGFPNGQQLRMNIWDTAGQEKFKSVGTMYYKAAHAAIIVYAINNEDSFQQLDSWLEHLDEHGDQPKIVKIIVGNKSDLPDRKVSIKEAKKYADSRGLQFFETSALNNEGISDLFGSIATAVRKTFQDHELRTT